MKKIILSLSIVIVGFGLGKTGYAKKDPIDDVLAQKAISIRQNVLLRYSELMTLGSVSNSKARVVLLDKFDQSLAQAQKNKDYDRAIGYTEMVLTLVRAYHVFKNYAVHLTFTDIHPDAIEDVKKAAIKVGQLVDPIMRRAFYLLHDVRKDNDVPVFQLGFYVNLINRLNETMDVFPSELEVYILQSAR